MTDVGRKYRFLVAGLPDEAPCIVDLPPDEARHAWTVLRIKAGREVELFDGRGRVARGRVAEAARRSVTVAVESVRRDERVGPRVHLAFAVPKGKRLDWLLEKATELGAASLRPVQFARSVAGGEAPSDAKRHRWALHCHSAAKQCGLNFLPELHDMTALADYLAAAPGETPGGVIRLLGDLAADAVPLARAIGPAQAGATVDLLVGPEGGLSDDERAAALAAGFLPVRLGTTTLRIETAAAALIAGLAAVCAV